jgi:hypothetical protein
VVIKFIHSGVIGAPDVFQIVLRFIEALVIVNAAAMLTDWAGMGCGGWCPCHEEDDTIAESCGCVDCPGLVGACCREWADRSRAFRERKVEALHVSATLARQRSEMPPRNAPEDRQPQIHNANVKHYANDDEAHGRRRRNVPGDSGAKGAVVMPQETA